MEITVELGKNSYPIIIARGILDRVNAYMKLDRKVLVRQRHGKFAG